MRNYRLLTSVCALAFTGLMFAQEAQRIEYFFDSDPGHGSGILVDAKTGTNSFSVPVNHLTEGAHLLCFRSQDSNGAWSSTYTRPMLVLSDKASETAKIECFFDKDPGFGKASTFGANNGGNSLSISVDTLKSGAHLLCLRSQDVQGRWSSTLTHPIYVMPGKPSTLSRLEYFFDSDPGFGNATAIAGAKDGEETYSLSLSGLDAGAHSIHLRGQDNQGNWSSVWNRTFYVYSLQAVTRVEYFIDNDPGEGNATMVGTLASDESEQELAFDVDLSGMAVGDHYLYVRAVDALGQWSTVSQEPFTIVDANGIAEVTWTQQVGVSYSEGECHISRAAEAVAPCRVLIATVGGQVVAEAEWAASDTEISVPVSVSNGTVLIVSVTNKETGLRTVKRVLVRG